MLCGIQVSRGWAFCRNYCSNLDLAYGRRLAHSGVDRVRSTNLPSLKQQYTYKNSYSSRRNLKCRKSIRRLRARDAGDGGDGGDAKDAGDAGDATQGRWGH